MLERIMNSEKSTRGDGFSGQPISWTGKGCVFCSRSANVEQYRQISTVLDRPYAIQDADITLQVRMLIVNKIAC